MSLVISDKDNFIIIDPNAKEITENGVSKIVPKAIEQEDLIIFCNLKSHPKERSYILQGSDNEIVSVASGQFNLLKPNQNKDKFTTDWTDINLQNGQLNGEEALGITSVDVAYDTSYVPRVTINMIDVRSQALNSYEEGSPYKTFFSFPYPLFILEMKGYYGKLVKYILHLKKYNSRYNNSTGNFEITCEFEGFTFAVLSDLNVYLGLVAPQMKLPINGGINGIDVLRSIYDNQIKNEKDSKKRQEIEDIKNLCPTLTELIRKANDIQSYYSDFALKSPKIFEQKVALDEYLVNSEAFLTQLNKTSINKDNINANKKDFNEQNAVKIYGELKITTPDLVKNDEDVTKFIEEIKKLQNNAAEKYKEIDKKINESLSENITSFLGFKPTIENVFRIICNNFQTFLSLLSQTSLAAGNDTERSGIYNEQKNNKNEITQQLEQVFPWPYVWDNKGKIQLPPGDDSNGLKILNYPELSFVDEYIKAQRETNDLLEISGGTSMPITSIDFNPIHLIQYKKDKPFNYNTDIKINDILYEILEHALIAGEFQEYSIITNLAKSDTQNMIQNLGVVGSNFNTLKEIRDINSLVGVLKDNTNAGSFKEVFDNLKNNFKILKDINISEKKAEVVMVDETIILGLNDFGTEGSLETFIKSTRPLDSQYRYYDKMSGVVKIKYDDSSDNLIYYGYPTITYDKEINLPKLKLNFLDNILFGYQKYNYKLAANGETITEQEYFSNPSIAIREFNVDFYESSWQSKLKNTDELNKSFKNFMLNLMELDGYYLTRKLEQSEWNIINQGIKSLYNYIIGSNPLDNSFYFGIDDELYQKLKDFEEKSSILLTKFYVVLFSTLRNKNENSIYKTNDLKTAVDTLTSGGSLNENLNNLDDNYNFVKFNNLLKYVGPFDYDNFLLDTYSEFLKYMIPLFRDYINSSQEIKDKYFNVNATNGLNLSEPLEKSSLSNDQSKSFYKYVTDWLNSDVTAVNASAYPNYKPNIRYPYVDYISYVYQDPYGVAYVTNPNILNVKTQKTASNTQTNLFVDNYINIFIKELFNTENTRFLDTSLNIKESQAKKESLITDENVKLSIYLHFKNINDKWVYVKPGGKITYAFNLTGDVYDDNDNGKDLIDYFYFVDRGNRYIGDIINIDIQSLKNYLEKNNGNNSLYALIGDLLSKNEMNFHALTSYISYKDKNKVEDIFNPQLNTLQAGSQPAFICQYIGKPATYQYDNQNHFPDYLKFNFDTEQFTNSDVGKELFGTTENVLNKAVCFTVDVGIQNQNVFKNIQLDQSEFRETQESLIVVDKLTSRDANKFSETIGNNLFNVYSRRSYTCKVETFGNLMIQPTMYFYLRYIPLFNGLYLITKVSHNLQGNSITTNFEGVRVPIFTFPIAENFIATLSKNVYSNYKTNVLPNYTPNNQYYDNEINQKPLTKNSINVIYNELKNNGINNNYAIAAILAVVSKETNFLPKREIETYTKNIASIKSLWTTLKNKIFLKEISPAGDDTIKFMAENPIRYYNKLYYGKNGNKSETKKSVEYESNNKTTIIFDDSPEGDGYKYRGGGFNQITGRNTYKQYGLENNPEKINDIKTAANVLAKFNIDNIKLLKEKDKYGISGMTGLQALNTFTDLNTAYDAIFNVTGGIGYTLEEAISRYGDSYLRGVVNLQSLYDAIENGKIA